MVSRVSACEIISDVSCRPVLKNISKQYSIDKNVKTATKYLNRHFQFQILPFFHILAKKQPFYYQHLEFIWINCFNIFKKGFVEFYEWNSRRLLYCIWLWNQFLTLKYRMHVFFIFPNPLLTLLFLTLKSAMWTWLWSYLNWFYIARIQKRIFFIFPTWVWNNWW